MEDARAKILTVSQSLNYSRFVWPILTFLKPHSSPGWSTTYQFDGHKHNKHLFSWILTTKTLLLVMHNTRSMILPTRPGGTGYIMLVCGPTDHQHYQAMQSNITRKHLLCNVSTYDIKWVMRFNDPGHPKATTLGREQEGDNKSKTGWERRVTRQTRLLLLLIVRSAECCFY